MQDLLKFFVNEVSRVHIGHEGFSKVHSFLINMLGVRYSLTPKAVRIFDPQHLNQERVHLTKSLMTNG